MKIYEWTIDIMLSQINCIIHKCKQVIFVTSAHELSCIFILNGMQCVRLDLQNDGQTRSNQP